MDQAARGEERAGLFQRAYHGAVGVARLAVGCQHALAGEQRHGSDEHAVGAHGLGYRQAMRDAEFPVVGAVARRDVDDAGAGIHVDEAGDQRRDVEIVPAPVQGMAANRPSNPASSATRRQSVMLVSCLTASANDLATTRRSPGTARLSSPAPVTS